MILLCAVVFIGGVLAAGWRDLVSYTIPNGLSIAVAVAGLVAVVLAGASLPVQLGFALLVLVVGAALFFVKLWGAGDAKLLAAVALWVPPAYLPALLVWVVLSGGVLSLLIIVARRLRIKQPWPLFSAVLSPEKGVPYGIAIALGGLVLLFSDRTVIIDTFFPR